jgi:hypothetical protein
MLTIPTVRGALPHFEAVQTCSVAVAATRTASALVMDLQLDLAQRALGLNDCGDGSLSLPAEQVGHQSARATLPVGSGPRAVQTFLG